jgi:PPOX class probable F420-dependent enzyme
VPQHATLPNLDGDRRVRAERRLHDETIIWLTTVRADGQPQTSPVGFLWKREHLTIISKPDHPKVRNLRANPKVSLHLDIERDADDGGVLTIEGTAVLEEGPLTGDDATAYVARYRDDMASAALTPEQVLAEYSGVIRVTPTRIRSY